ncbi:MAG TPA: hypothetical protein VNA89_06155 [Gemmatimonadaceae bacterium]|nr:hypothetical protein [Gemmatimonadaceae bacterium]
MKSSSTVATPAEPGSGASAAAGAPTNIGRRGRRARRALGLAALTAGVLLAVGLAVAGAPRASRLIVAPLFFMAGLGLFQARAGVCVALAARRLDSSDDGAPRLIADGGTCDLFALRARAVYRSASLLTVALTLAALALP